MQQTQEKITEVRELIYQFSDSELQQMGDELSKLVLDHVKVELEKKEVTKSYSDQLKAKMKLIKQLSYKIDNGAEVRDVSCQVFYNDPVYGRKKIVRMDTGDYWDEPMDDGEFDLFTQADYGDDEEILSWEEE